VKCGSSGYIWYPKPPGGFRHCVPGSTVNAPPGSSSTHPLARQQSSSNTENAAQGASTTGNGATSQQSSKVKICRESFAICNSGKGKMENVLVHNPPPLSGTGYVPVKCGSSGYIWYPKPPGGFRHCVPGSTVNAPPGSSSTHPLARLSQQSSNTG
jgi:hypothetical protein